MPDPRVLKLAHTIVHYSCSLQQGEKFLIQTYGPADELARVLVQEAAAAGALPFVWRFDERMERELLLGGSREQCELLAAHDAAFMAQMDAFCGVRAPVNPTELSDLPPEKLELLSSYNKAVHSDVRVPRTKWVVLRYPTPSMAQQAHMSLSAFEDYYYSVCCLDYSKMSQAMQHLKRRMERAGKVRIAGPGTDLTFSIANMPAIPCDGKINLPDGEVYTAPVKESVNGVIQYNTPSPYDGFVFENVKLTFKNGRIVHASANDNERLQRIFDTDEGARYVGEFAIGVNPLITSPMQEILFDEKIAGSIHLTPGCCYDDAPNGNKSAIHWDLVLIQTPEYGGGELWFDGELIRKDGRFVASDLLCLNPENLL